MLTYIFFFWFTFREHFVTISWAISWPIWWAISWQFCKKFVVRYYQNTCVWMIEQVMQNHCCWTANEIQLYFFGLLGRDTKKLCFLHFLCKQTHAIKIIWPQFTACLFVCHKGLKCFLKRRNFHKIFSLRYLSAPLKLAI